MYTCVFHTNVNSFNSVLLQKRNENEQDIPEYTQNTTQTCDVINLFLLYFCNKQQPYNRGTRNTHKHKKKRNSCLPSDTDEYCRLCN